MQFPFECPKSRNAEWSSVPWQSIDTIKTEVFYDRYKGPAVELLLDDDQINRFFRDVRLKKAFFDRAERVNGYFRIGHSNAFMKNGDVVKTLNTLKSNSRL